jgi:hypothetical protein
LSALTLFGVCRVTSARADASVLPAEAQARLGRAQDALHAGNVKQAAEIARPLFEAYPNDYDVQDLRCQSAILQYLRREEIDTQCARLKLLMASGAKPSPPRAQPEAAPPPPPTAEPAPALPSAASPAQPAPTEARPTEAREAPEPSEPPPPQSEPPSQEPPKPTVTARDMTARRYRGLVWSIRPGALFKSGSAGFSLGGQVEYGFDTGGVIVMPGVNVTAYFVQPNTYVAMPVMKLVLPVGSLALFIEGGAGIGEEVSNPVQVAPALMGGGGFAFHPGPSLILGLEGGYEALLDTDFRVIMVGPIFAFSF